MGPATETRNLIELFLTTRDNPSELPAGLWCAKERLDETAQRRIGEQFQRWHDYARMNPTLFGKVLQFEGGTRPAVVAAIPPGMRPLSRLCGASPLDLKGDPLRRLVRRVVELYRFLADRRVFTSSSAREPTCIGMERSSASWPVSAAPLPMGSAYLRTVPSWTFWGPTKRR